ncbi:MAG: hypothetical protein AAF462_04190 [Thermodesulfobacteriota bacterium]
MPYLNDIAIIFSIMSSDSDYTDALGLLFLTAKNTVESSKEVLSIYNLPTEFLEIFLDIPGRRGGFCIISSSKYVVFFDEEPNTITIIGKNRSKQSGLAQNSSKTSQLLKVSFSNVDGKYQYKDNTGGIINPNDIVDITINWALS